MRVTARRQPGAVRVEVDCPAGSTMPRIVRPGYRGGGYPGTPGSPNGPAGPGEHARGRRGNGQEDRDGRGGSRRRPDDGYDDQYHRY